MKRYSPKHCFLFLKKKLYGSSFQESYVTFFPLFLVLEFFIACFTYASFGLVVLDGGKKEEKKEVNIRHKFLTTQLLLVVLYGRCHF